MDPDANYQEQKRIMAIPPRHRTVKNRARLRDLKAALRDWLRGGGFPPKTCGKACKCRACKKAHHHG
jgi:hypothetical protein